MTDVEKNGVIVRSSSELSASPLQAETEKKASLVTTESQSPDSKEGRIAALQQEYGVDARKLMYKIDFCVIIPFCVLNLLSFLDRVNIGNANVYGLSKSLGLKNSQYNIALTAFFAPYFVFEVVSNYLIKFVKPRKWLSFLVFGFGVVTIGMGFVRTFGALVACRFLVGMTESGTVPLIFYLMASYYTKTEAQRRFLVFISVAALAGAASGAIAYRIKDLDGHLGLESWRWIFIVEGIVTCICAMVFYFTLAEFPEEARFLTANERAYLKKKLEIDNGAASAFEVNIKPREVLACLTDYLIWLPAIQYFTLIVPVYGYAYFAATIIKEMGYTAVSAQAHLIYPWLLAFFMVTAVAFALDYLKLRLPYVLGLCVVTLAGLAMVIGAPDAPRVRYGGCFLAVTGLFTALPLVVCWHSLNMGSHVRKSVGTAWQIGFGNLGGIIATFTFLLKESPRYIRGLTVLMSMIGVAMAASVVYFLALRYHNHRKQKPSYQAQFAAMSERDQLNAGDLNPSFRYLY